jgi:hypothetical protein
MTPQPGQGGNGRFNMTKVSLELNIVFKIKMRYENDESTLETFPALVQVAWRLSKIGLLKARRRKNTGRTQKSTIRMLGLILKK